MHLKKTKLVYIFQLFIFCILLKGSSIGQDYIEYQKIINRIDEDLLIKSNNSAIVRLDSLYSSYDFIYSRHCFKALQICSVLEDSINAGKWIEKSFLQGVPIWMIRSNNITKQLFKYSTTQSIVKKYDSLNLIYQNSINRSLRNKIDSLYEIDQEFTKKVNDGCIVLRVSYYGLRWYKNNRKQFKILNEIIDEYGYPGEKLIGLPESMKDSLRTVEQFNFWGPSLMETKAYIMLIHYYSNPRANINDKLYRNIISGNLPPTFFAAINDFIAKWGKNEVDCYYNVWHEDPNLMNIIEIEKRRNLIGLNSTKQQERISSELIERRKKRIINAEIMLE